MERDLLCTEPASHGQYGSAWSWQVHNAACCFSQHFSTLTLWTFWASSLLGAVQEKAGYLAASLDSILSCDNQSISRHY